MHKAVDFSCEFPSSLPAHNPVQNLDVLCSALAWNAATGAIFALEKIDLPLVDTSIALEAAGGDILLLVRPNRAVLLITKNLHDLNFCCTISTYLI